MSNHPLSVKKNFGDIYWNLPQGILENWHIFGIRKLIKGEIEGMKAPYDSNFANETHELVQLKYQIVLLSQSNR